jgi:hypothetical protein
MTDAELEAIEKACAEATPGPWHSTPLGTFEGPMWKMTDSRWHLTSNADAEFIASARSWVPALVEEVKRLRRKLGQPFVMKDGIPEPLVFPQDEARAAALEEAARVAEEYFPPDDVDHVIVASRIRALKGKP